ncbi:ectoine/hydroxyectoine ABC transporter substrate-binding protein EhuB [Hydrogenibacillus sp. N12]|uniref:ectoine/hydroxyectoine ABC transporter substrate-binding protein EhuB n=1 Tax=Hydrogenibacillus sp. N12 TaxID=2866627 RepID=UPI00207BE3B5|nr:ectoine/hydroxyectoine ABC transporter substrate-binding protein EhuB [Hydrogenibacillus sp. N12]
MKRTFWQDGRRLAVGLLGLFIAVAFVVAGCGSSGGPGGGTAPGGQTGTAEAPSGEGDGSGSGGEGAGEPALLKRLKEQGYVTVGLANEKPYAYQEADGTLTGEAIEVARAVFSELGVPEIRGQIVEFSSLIPGLKAKRFDVVTAGMFITPKRAEEVVFADPEYRIGEALAVAKGNPKNLRSYEDIAADPSLKVAVMSGAVEIDYLKAAGVREEQIVQVQDQPQAVKALETGRVDAITMTGPSLQAMLESAGSDKIERVEDFKQPVVDGKEVYGYGAAAFRKEDADLAKRYSEKLHELEQSGKLLELLRPFGFTEAELPNGMTADAVLKEAAK